MFQSKLSKLSKPKNVCIRMYQSMCIWHIPIGALHSLSPHWTCQFITLPVANQRCQSFLTFYSCELSLFAECNSPQTLTTIQYTARIEFILVDFYHCCFFRQFSNIYIFFNNCEVLTFNKKFSIKISMLSAFLMLIKI